MLYSSQSQTNDFMLTIQFKKKLFFFHREMVQQGEIEQKKYHAPLDSDTGEVVPDVHGNSGKVIFS